MTSLEMIFAQMQLYLVHYNLVGSASRVHVCLKIQLPVSTSSASLYVVFDTTMKISVFSRIPAPYRHSSKISLIIDKTNLTSKFPDSTNSFVSYCAKFQHLLQGRFLQIVTFF